MATVYKRRGKQNRHGYYYVQWFDHTGKRRTKCAKTTDKAAAERIASKFEADAALRRDGVIDPSLDSISKESRRTIESHLGDFEAKLIAAKRNPQYIRETGKYIRTICEASNFLIASDIKADAVNRFAMELLENGKSSRTVQANLTAIKGFSKWLATHDKLERDPLVSVKKPDPNTDRRRERRMLLPDEWQWLRSTTLAAPVRYGMAGNERAILYQLAIETGLRSNELRSLTRGRLFLAGDKPYVTCKAGSTKNKKLAKQYIQVDLANRLQSHIGTKTPRANLFNLPDPTEMAEMLRADLADARKSWIESAKHDVREHELRQQSDFLTDKNHEDELLDFHALRHTCGAWLAMAGEHPKVVQTIMRHSTISLTMDTYGHLFPGQASGAVDSLAQFTNPTVPAQATGTADADARPCGGDSLTPPASHGLESSHTHPRALQLAQQSGRDLSQEDATECEKLAEDHGQINCSNPLRLAEIGDTLLHGTSPCDHPAPLAQLAEQLTLNQ